MSSVVPILSTLAGQVAAWLLLVFLLASAPNSSPAQELAIKRWCITTVAIGLVSLVAAVWLLVIHHTWLSSVVGVVPAGLCFVVLLIMLKMQA